MMAGYALNVLEFHLTAPLQVLSDYNGVVNNLGNYPRLAILVLDLANDLQFLPVLGTRLALADLANTVGKIRGLGRHLALHVESVVFVLLSQDIIVVVLSCVFQALTLSLPDVPKRFGIQRVLVLHVVHVAAVGFALTLNSVG